MAISGLKTWADGDELTPANMNADKAVIEAKFSGGIVTADIADDAVTNDKIANPHYELILKFTVRNRDAAPAGAELLDYNILPDLATDGPYTITDCEYFISDSGSASNTTVTIASGYVTGGAFSATTTHVNAQTIANDSDNPKNGTLTVATAAVPASANNSVLRMTVTLGDASILSVDGSVLIVVLKLKRTNGLRN